MYFAKMYTRFSCKDLPSDDTLRKLLALGSNPTKTLCDSIEKDKNFPKDKLPTIIKLAPIDIKWNDYALLIQLCNVDDVFIYLYSLVSKEDIPYVNTKLASKLNSLEATKHILDQYYNDEILHELLNLNPKIFLHVIHNYTVDLMKASYNNLDYCFEDPIVLNFLVEQGLASYFAIGSTTRRIRLLLENPNWNGLTSDELLQMNCVADTLLLLIGKGPIVLTDKLYSEIRNQLRYDTKDKYAPTVNYFFDSLPSNIVIKYINGTTNLGQCKELINKAYAKGMVTKQDITLWCCTQRLILLKELLLDDVLYEISKYML